MEKPTEGKSIDSMYANAALTATPTHSDADILKAIDILKSFSEQSEQLTLLSEEQRVELLKYAGLVSRPDRLEIIKRQKDVKKYKRGKKKLANKSARKFTGIRSARDSAVFVAPKQLTTEKNNTATNTITTEPIQNPGEYVSEHNCYVCKAKFTKIHHFYDTMCVACGDLNYNKRFQRADLSGQVALITGSRLKIGYHATLQMLRSGATVIATTRFPIDSAIRYSKEEDYNDWKHRLQIYGLDLRHTPSVELFARYIENNYDRLDILINNAAQTVRRPNGFYAHLMANERKKIAELAPEVALLLAKHHAMVEHLQDHVNSNTIDKGMADSGDSDSGDSDSGDSDSGVTNSNKTNTSKISIANSTNKATNKLTNNKNIPIEWHSKAPGIGIRASAELSQIPYSFDNSLVTDEVFPQGKLDADLQQVDLRKTNSWRLRLGEIQIPEMLEVQLVNAVAPFVLVNHLIGLMRKDNTGKKHIVNVTAMEGKFHRFKKADRHPHTNMAKAALNMMTHTSAMDFAKDGIYMNAVDTGWVTDEDPAELSRSKQEVHDFQPPLDIVDGAARVCDPFIDGINTGKHWCGKFLKDYFPIDW